MNKRVHMIGGDSRTAYAAARLHEWGWNCETYHVPGLPDTFDPKAAAVKDWLLPYPAIREGKITGTADSAEDFLAFLKSGQMVIGGGMQRIRAPMEAVGADVYDIAEDEALLSANAVATAEGAIALAEELLPCTLYKTGCLVVGYGRIGRILSRMLRAMNADVTASARKTRDLAAIEADGLKSEITGAWQLPLLRYRCIINTVPCPVFSDSQLETLHPDGIFLDLASAPYGIKPEQLPRLQERYHRASGLPGKMSPESAGLYYARAVRRKLEQEAP